MRRLHIGLCTLVWCFHILMSHSMLLPAAGKAPRRATRPEGAGLRTCRAATAAEGRKLTGKEYFLQSDGRGRDAVRSASRISLPRLAEFND